MYKINLTLGIHQLPLRTDWVWVFRVLPTSLQTADIQPVEREHGLSPERVQVFNCQTHELMVVIGQKLNLVMAVRDGVFGERLN